MHTDLTDLTVTQDTSFREAIAQVDRNRQGIVLVVDTDSRLVGTITDGDLRRAVLANTSLDQPVRVLLDRKTDSSYAQPVTAPRSSDRATLLRLLREHSIRHIPLVDEEQRVVALATLDDFLSEQKPPELQAVVMAGGYGSRLRPLTEDLPKPMLPVGDRPLMEIILEQLQQAGIQRVDVAVHHQSEKITGHFGDGRDFGVQINYVTEERPLGTAGALGLMEPPTSTMLVINGDILTQVDFKAMLDYHQEQRADLTVAVQSYEVQVPYGVIECEGTQVRGLAEKPQLKLFVNAGIYLLEPSVHRFIPAGERLDMTELIQRLIDEGQNVAAFPIREYWMDIGEHADYRQAQEQVKTWERTS